MWRGNQRKSPIFPESQSKFFVKVVDAQLEFFSGANGQISHLVLHQNGHDTRGARKRQVRAATDRCPLRGHEERFPQPRLSGRYGFESGPGRDNWAARLLGQVLRANGFLQ
jgi:hypothetical protein